MVRKNRRERVGERYSKKPRKEGEEEGDPRGAERGKVPSRNAMSSRGTHTWAL